MIYAVKLEAKIVTLNNAYTEALSQEVIEVKSSDEAKAYAKSLDEDKDTHSAVLEYYLTSTGSGVFGDVKTYAANFFRTQIEPQLVLM